MNEATAEKLLRPDLDELLEAWRVIVRAEREQVERLPDRPRPEDYYAPVAESFRGQTAPQADPVLGRLLEIVQPGEVWLDVGAGGGRFTLPLAGRAGKIYAIEPSRGMRDVLTSAIAANNVTNIEVLDERWPAPSRAPKGEVSFISHVGYDIEKIGAFLTEMESHASRACIAVLFNDAPMTYFAPLWRYVHGEDRIVLPGLREFIAVLFARGRTPAVELISLGPRAYADVDSLHAASRRAIWVRPESDLDARLAAAVRQLAVPVATGVALAAAERLVAIVIWGPD
jgi:hypothetical protein